MRHAAVAAVLIATMGIARAGEPDQVALFGRFCLDRFPAGDPAEGAAGDVTPMAAGQVTPFLRGDSGRGWFVDEGSVQNVLVIEDRPVRACTLRRVYDRPPDLIPAWAALLKAWASRTGRGSFDAREPLTVTQSGASFAATMMSLPATGKAGDEVFVAIMVKGSDGAAELRLVRNMP